MRKNQRRRLKNAFEEPQINMTPLIDVIFVILIMFIVVAPLLDIDRIELAGSHSDRNQTLPAPEQNPVTIRVYQDNTLQFNGHKVLLPQLTKLLITSKKSYPGARPQVFHDKRASFGTYQGVKNAVEAAGFKEMDIVLAPGA